MDVNGKDCFRHAQGTTRPPRVRNTRQEHQNKMFTPPHPPATVLTFLLSSSLTRSDTICGRPRALLSRSPHFRPSMTFDAATPPGGGGKRGSSGRCRYPCRPIIPVTMAAAPLRGENTASTSAASLLFLLSSFRNLASLFRNTAFGRAGRAAHHVMTTYPPNIRGSPPSLPPRASLRVLPLRSSAPAYINGFCQESPSRPPAASHPILAAGADRMRSRMSMSMES